MAATQQFHVYEMPPNGGSRFLGSIVGGGRFEPARTNVAPGTIGLWSDLDQSAGGVVAITGTPGVVQVSWSGVPYFGQAGTSTTFSVGLDTAGSQLALIGRTTT